MHSNDETSQLYYGNCLPHKNVKQLNNDNVRKKSSAFTSNRTSEMKLFRSKMPSARP